MIEKLLSISEPWLQYAIRVKLLNEGNASLQKRRDMFYERLNVVKRQMDELRKTMDTIKYKYWYYDTALAVGT